MTFLMLLALAASAMPGQRPALDTPPIATQEHGSTPRGPRDTVRAPWRILSGWHLRVLRVGSESGGKVFISGAGNGLPWPPLNAIARAWAARGSNRESEPPRSIGKPSLLRRRIPRRPSRGETPGGGRPYH